MKIGLNIEGQLGLTWHQWRHIVDLAERLGFPSLFRSDHFFTGGSRGESLDPFLTFVTAAERSSRIRFGPLVTPITFRSPVHIGRMAAQLDLLSDGRFVLGIGLGWNEPEHTAFGFPYPPARDRVDMLDEALRLMKMLWTEESATFDGEYFQLAEASLRPRPAPGRPPVLLGGAGDRSLQLVARHAAEWSCPGVWLTTGEPMTPAHYKERLELLERFAEAEGRDVGDIRKSMLIPAYVGPSEDHVDRHVRLMRGLPGDAPASAVSAAKDELKASGALIGGAEEMLERLRSWEEAGLDEVQFEHFFFDEDDVPEFLAAEVAPEAARM